MSTFGQAESAIGGYRSNLLAVSRNVQALATRVNALKAPNVRVTEQQTSQLLKDIQDTTKASRNSLLATNTVAQTAVNSLPAGEQKDNLQKQLVVLDTAGGTSLDQLDALNTETLKIQKNLKDNSRPPVSPPVPAPNLSNNKVNDDATKQKEKNEQASTDEGKNLAGNNSKSNTRLNQRVDRRNPLSRFSSYTYNISFYAITADDVNNFYRLGKWDTSKLELILQSGGINNGLDAPRNKWFNYDFSIDNLEIVSLINSKETGSATTSYDFKFQIFEPYAMTFPSRLVFMEKELQERAAIRKKITQQIDALNTPKLLVIRFFGYDANGNLISAEDSPGIAQFTQTNQPAAFERAFPILFSKFTFRLENKVTVYDIQAKVINEQIGFGTKRGLVETPISVNAGTVEEAIGGTANQTDGFIDKINRYMKGLVGTNADDKKIGVADEYRIVFNDTSIANASIVDKDYWTKVKAPVATVKNTAEVNDKKAAATNSAARGKRTIEIAPGTPILTAIDQIITQSTYVTDALLASDKEVQPVAKGERDAEDNPKPKQISWYTVTPKVEFIAEDTIRNDYAYRVTYYIDKYSVPYAKSLYINSAADYPGPTKIYEYFYTGQNTEILSYEQQYNLLYFSTAVAVSEAGVKSSDGTTPNQPKPTTGADATGKLSGKFEIPNTLKTYLYSPSDNLKADIQILGDPDFLVTTTETVLRNTLTPDVTVNPNAGPVFIEIDFKQVEDYGASGDYPPKFLDNGLLNPNNNIVFWEYSPEIAKQTEGRMVYMLTRVNSKFSGGKFTQQLKTVLPNFARSEGQQIEQDNGRKDAEAAKQKAQNPSPRLTPQQIEKQTQKVTGVDRNAATRLREIDNRIIPNTTLDDNKPNRTPTRVVDVDDEDAT
jgi:hypothetical protein